MFQVRVTLDLYPTLKKLKWRQGTTTVFRQRDFCDIIVTKCRLRNEKKFYQLQTIRSPISSRLWPLDKRFFLIYDREKIYVTSYEKEKKSINLVEDAETYLLKWLQSSELYIRILRCNLSKESHFDSFQTLSLINLRETDISQSVVVINFPVINNEKTRTTLIEEFSL